MPAVDLRASADAASPVEPRTWRTVLRAWRLPLLCILLPTLIGLVYWGLIASPRYTARSEFYLKQERETADALGGSLLGILGGTQSANDDLVVTNYIESLDLLHEIDQELGVKAHFQERRWDWFSRLAGDATDVDFLEYMKRRIKVVHDTTTGITTLDVQAFDPQFAQRMAQAILARSEHLVNDLGHRMVRSRQQFFEQELAQARGELNKAKQELLAFQNEHGVISAHGEADTLGTIAAGLETDLARERAALSELLSVHPEGSDVIERQRARITGLQDQLNEEMKRLAGTADAAKGRTLVNELTARQEDLETEVAFKAEAYKVATVAYEQARSELNQKLKHLLVIVNPNLPDEASDPTVWYNTLTLLLAAVMLYGIGRMVASTIREHRD